jgi:hypothetical protein
MSQRIDGHHWPRSPKYDVPRVVLFECQWHWQGIQRRLKVTPFRRRRLKRSGDSASHVESLLRLFRDHFAVLPKVDGSSVHARDLAGGPFRELQATADPGGEALRLVGRFALSGHGPLSTIFAGDLELSSITQSSANGL